MCNYIKSAAALWLLLSREKRRPHTAQEEAAYCARGGTKELLMVDVEEDNIEISVKENSGPL